MEARKLARTETVRQRPLASPQELRSSHAILSSARHAKHIEPAVTKLCFSNSLQRTNKVGPKAPSAAE
eukprot:scaffold81464_cov25-Prasinocladus_malaysianus.AAC.2